MANTRSKVFLHVLNAITLVIGLAIASASIWFFCQVNEFTRLRNSNHYLLDYTVYWPQAIPWLFFFVALFVIGVSVCGFAGARKKNRGLLTVYIVLSSIVILCLIAASVVALVFADTKSTDDFVQDTIYDAYFQSKTDSEVADSFGAIERKLHCCGANNPRDYKAWKSEFPQSCCDVFYHGFLDTYTIECEFTNKLANERHGCSAVASYYAKIAIKVLSGASVFTAIIGIMGVVAAVTLSKGLGQRKRPAVPIESESKKVLL